MFIVWRHKKSSAFAYLHESYWDKMVGSPRQRIVYLGSTLKDARAKLESYLNSGQVAIPALEQLSLLEQLRDRAPEQKPKVDRSLEATKKILQKRTIIHKDHPAVVATLNEALSKLENIREGEEDAKESR